MWQKEKTLTIVNILQWSNFYATLENIYFFWPLMKLWFDFSSKTLNILYLFMNILLLFVTISLRVFHAQSVPE